MTTPGGPADATLGIQPVIPVHNLAVKSEIVPGGRRRQSVIAGGITKTENLIDLGAARKAERDINAPNFFVLVSETSLFAGQPNISGAIDGPCSIAKFNTPSDIVVDRNQQLFIADTDNARIRRISKQGIVSTVAAIGGGDGDIENFPHGLAFDQRGAMYILQSGLKHQIFQVAPGAGVVLLAGTDEKGHKDTMSNLLEASFNHPRATGVDSQNRIYICDKNNNAIRRIDMVKKTVITLLGPGGQPLDLLNPEGIVVDQYDDVFIADTGHHRILKISFVINQQTGNEETLVSNYCGKYGVASYANGPAANSLLHSPTGLAIDKMNHLWICDSGNNCIRMMAHGAELVFTVSGKGSIEQERTYNYPTSIALSYDAMYGAEMADSAPESVRNDPTHPLYYSYITPVIFVADSGSHCIRKIHTVMMEGAKALIDVCTPAPAVAGQEVDDYPMHSALSYGILNQRNDLMSVLLMLKPQLLQQKNKDDRIPLHIACLESQTSTAGTISMDIIHKMLGMAVPNPVASIMCEDKQGRIPVSYALEKMQEHTMNIASEKLERGDDDEPDVDNPDLPYDASRHLLNAMLSLCPEALFHPSCQEYTLHTLIAAGVPLKFLKKFAQAIEDARENYEQEGMLESAFTTMFELKAAALAQYPNPFFVRDGEGKLPIHVAAAMHAQGTPVALDVLMWLVLVSQLPPQSQGALPSVRWRDWSLKASLAAGKKPPPGTEAVEGHHPMFYACVLPRAAAPNAPAGGAQLHKPLHKIPKGQKEAIEYLLDAWPESILQNEAAGVLHQSPFQSTSMKPMTFLEWVFYHRSIELLEIFCRKMPQCLDRIVWLDTLDVLTPAEADASVIDKYGKRQRRKSAGPNKLTMLHSAARIGDAELLEIVLKNSANPFLGDKRDKLPVDYAEDDKCRTLLLTYMDKDPRKPIPQMVTIETGVQTEEDLAAEKAKAEAAAAAAEAAAAAKEAEFQAQLAAEREAARLKAEEEDAKHKAELEAERQRLEAEKQAIADAAEAEKRALLEAAAAEKARLAAEAEAEAARLAAEAEEEKKRREHAWQLADDERVQAEEARVAEQLRIADEAKKAEQARQDERQRLIAEMEAEKARLAAEAEAERRRLEEEKARLLASDADREAARLKFEAEMKAAAEAEAARLAALQAQLQADAEAEKQRLAAETEAEKQRLAAEQAEKDAQRAALEARLAAEAEAEKARLAALDAEREAARLALEEELRLAAEKERQRLEDEMAAEKLRLAALDAEREAARIALEAKMKQEAEEAEERERLRNLKNQKLQEQRDASRAAAEQAEAARAAAEEELARLKAMLDAAAAEKAAAEAAAAAAEAARLAAEADAEEARRRREHQWNLNAEHEERLRKEQEAAIAARPPSASRELGDLKRVPQKKKQTPAELAALARAQAAIEAAAAKRNAPKKILGFGSSTLKDEKPAAGVK